MGVDMAAAVTARMGVQVAGVAVARMSLAAGTGVVATGKVGVGIMLVLAGAAVAVTGMAVAGMAAVAAGIMVVTAAVGELAPRLVSVLALDYSGERLRPLPIMAATTTGMITRRMPVPPRLRSGIGVTPITDITLRSPNARFRGDRLFSNGRRQFLARFEET
jgi:hypothetical protein